MDAVEEITRAILWNIDPLTKTAMYLLSVAAFAAMGYGFWRRAKIWRRGRHAWKPANPADATNGEAAAASPAADRPGSPAEIATRLVRHVFVQERIARIPWAWLSHIAIFYGFIVLFIGTVIVALEHYGIFGLVGIHWTGRFYTSTSFALDRFGLAFVAALVIAIGRRLRADACALRRRRSTRRSCGSCY